MGRKQTSKKKYSKNSRKSKKNLSTDMLGGFLVVVGFVFFILLAFDSMGAFSIFLKSLLFGIFGKAAFLIPLTMCIVGIYAIMSDSQVVISKELKKGILLVFLVAPLIYSFSSSNYDMFANVVKYAVDSFNEGVGGTVGALICGVAVKLIGITPTKVLFSMLTFVAILCVFNISFAQFFKIIKNIVIEKFHIIDLIKFCITIYFPQKKNHHFLMFRMNILITILFKFVRWNLKKILQCLKNQESFLFQFYLILKFLRL